jgi:hypothetical protein
LIHRTKAWIALGILALLFLLARRSSIVEFGQAALQNTEADIQGTDAEYQYRLTQIVLAFTMSAPK